MTTTTTAISAVMLMLLLHIFYKLSVADYVCFSSYFC